MKYTLHISLILTFISFVRPDDHSRRYNLSDLDLDDKTPTSTTPTTVLMPPSFPPVLPGPPTPPDELPGACGMSTDDDDTSTTTLSGEMSYKIAQICYCCCFFTCRWEGVTTVTPL